MTNPHASATGNPQMSTTAVKLMKMGHQGITAGPFR